MSIWAVIVAGGIGSRMKADKPKQLLEIGGKTILEWTLTPFAACSGIDGIIVAAGTSIIPETERIVTGFSALDGRCKVIEGGKERRDSVRNALDTLPEDVEIVVIHDAVRPFISPQMIDDGIRGAREYGAVTVMRPLKETVKVVKDGVVRETPDRSTLWITQTPQTFKRTIICEAHQRALEDNVTGTDDCMLVERLGYPVHILEGNDLNIKITTPADLRVAEALLPYFQDWGI